MQKNLTPIPIPLRHRWREFRIAYLPLLTFVALIGIIGWMWKSYVQPSAIIGEVESIRADIISTSDGTLDELRVDRLQPVVQGQELAVISPFDNDQIRAEVAAAESELRLMKARMDLDRTRNQSAYAELRLSLAEERLNLDLARINLTQAQQEFERAEKLLESQLISRGVGSGLSGGNLVGSRNDFGYEVALRDRDALKTEVETRERAVAELDQSIQQLEKAGLVQIEPADQAVEQAIAAQRERIQVLQNPVVLRSPINGFVSELNHRPGQKVAAGDPILVISGGESDRIVAWVNQPIAVRPQIGDRVEVRRMGMGESRFEATVIQVGTQLEEVSPMLRSPTANPERIEVGLPLLVQGESIRQLIPGEPVLLRVLQPAHL